MLAALGVRLYRIGQESAWFDEVASLQHLGAPDLLTFLRLERSSDPPMVPVYFTIEYLWSRLTDGSAFSMRVLSIIFGCLGIALIARWAWEYGGPWAGLVSASVCGLSVPHVYYSQEIRPYALVMLLATGSSYAFLRALRTSERRWWAVNVSANILLMWTHLFASFLLLAEGLFFAAYALWRGRLRSFLVWAIVHVPSFLLWGLWFLTIDYHALDDASAWKSDLVHGPRMLVEAFTMFAGGRFFWLREAPLIPGIPTGALFALLFLAALIGLGWKIIRGSKRPRDGDPSASQNGAALTYAFWLTWLVVPPVALVLFSSLLYPSHLSRYVIYSMAPLHLLAGGFVASLRRSSAKVAFTAALVALYATNMAMVPRPWRLDWNAAASHVKSQMKPADALLVMGDTHRLSLAYAMQLGPEQIQAGRSAKEVVEKAGQSIAAGHTAWVTGRVDVFSMPGSENLESALAAGGLACRKAEFGNAQPALVVYRVQTGPTSGP
jgi:4-amino-4-deoxy-L-arabinose transferase-like glycosyltransferase